MGWASRGNCDPRYLLEMIAERLSCRSIAAVVPLDASTNYAQLDVSDT